MVLLLVRIFLWQSRRNRKGDPLSLQAELALRALESGESFKNVIVRCYTEMSLILQREQGLALEETMTAQEFERLLIARGIPHPPIDQLTCLFEAARYGIDRLKEIVPIWKKEVYEGGEVWIGTQTGQPLSTKQP